MREPGIEAGSLREFAAENGWLLMAMKATGAAMRRLRDHLLARRLKTTGLRIGRYPKLAGLAHMRVAANLSAGDGLWLEAVTAFAGTRYQPLITIGANVNLSDHVHVACTNRVTIGDGVLSGSRVIITDHSHGIYAGGIDADHQQSSPEVRPVERKLSNDKIVVIGRNVWLGDGVAVLGGAEIGDGAIIGANSVVNGTVPAFCIAVGAPARPIRRWDFETSQWVAWTG
jgi:acetyltransferase-like isoleucine patch superfamily enzyme